MCVDLRKRLKLKNSTGRTWNIGNSYHYVSGQDYPREAQEIRREKDNTGEWDGEQSAKELEKEKTEREETQESVRSQRPKEEC